MVKVICDRCGGEINANGYIGYIAWNFRKWLGDDMLSDNPLEDKHFCQNCMDEIMRFVRGEQLVKQPRARRKAGKQCSSRIEGREKAGAEEPEEQEEPEVQEEPEEKEEQEKQKDGSRQVNFAPKQSVEWPADGWVGIEGHAKPDQEDQPKKSRRKAAKSKPEKEEKPGEKRRRHRINAEKMMRLKAEGKKVADIAMEMKMTTAAVYSWFYKHRDET